MSDEHTRNASDFSGDDRDEMTRRPRLDDRTADALFSGRIPPGREDHADVAAFADALRAAAAAAPAPAPSPALHALLADGLSPDTRDLPATVGTAAPASAARWSGVPTRRRTKKMLELLIAKLAGVSLLAKTGIASAAVLAGTTGAGVAGGLPPQAQDAFDRTFSEASDEPADRDTDEAVETDATETDATDTGTDADETVDVVTEETTETTETTDDESDDTGEGSRPEVPGAEGRANADANAGENGQHGRDNATEAATDGREFGQRKAAEARQRNEDAPADPEGEDADPAAADGRQTADEASEGRAGGPADDEDEEASTDPEDDTTTGDDTPERGAPDGTPAGAAKDSGSAPDSAGQNASTNRRP